MVSSPLRVVSSMKGGEQILSSADREEAHVSWPPTSPLAHSLWQTHLPGATLSPFSRADTPNSAVKARTRACAHTHMLTVTAAC